MYKSDDCHSISYSNIKSDNKTVNFSTRVNKKQQEKEERIEENPIDL